MTQILSDRDQPEHDHENRINWPGARAGDLDALIEARPMQPHDEIGGGEGGLRGMDSRSGPPANKHAMKSRPARMPASGPAKSGAASLTTGGASSWNAPDLHRR